MSRRHKWHEVEAEGEYILTRCAPARFDISASTRFPLLDRSRLAHQVRQDLWRSLQNLRGFSPAIRIEILPDHLILTAGGPCSHVTRHAQEAVQALLDDPSKRARWIRCAPLRRYRRREMSGDVTDS